MQQELNTMATFQKRNGRVTATVRIKPHPAKSKTFDTMRDAKEWAKSLEVSLKNEKEMIFDHIIFKDALTMYRDTVASKGKNATREMSRINFLLKNMNIDVPLKAIDKNYLVHWRELRLESVIGATVRRELVTLAGFLTWCVETKLWIPVSPMKGFKFPRDSNHREKVISPEEIELLLPHLDDEIKDIFMLALETGMRQAEICELTWDRVKLEQRYLYLKTSKNGRPREVPLSLNAIEVLKGRGPKTSGPVFSYKPKHASKVFMQARIAANLLDLTFHDTRHTAATRIALKLPILDLCKMFGWSNPKRAMVYYNPTATEIASRL